MQFAARSTRSWKLASRSLSLGERTLVMAIINITPDSFSDGGSSFNPEAAVAKGLQALEAGADLLDLGAESTRPGSHAGGAAPLVSAALEQARLLPVIESILKDRPAAVLSIDTYKAETARAALAAGAQIINDVSGFTWEPAIAQVAAKAGVVLSHTRGTPDAWASLPALAADELLRDVRSGLAASLKLAANAGIPAESIVIDPGYGFGKRREANFTLLARQSELLTLGYPLLAGLSRKSFLGSALAALRSGVEAPPASRDHASLAALTAAILAGASIVRVHAVRPAVEAACIADAVLAAAPH